MSSLDRFIKIIVLISLMTSSIDVFSQMEGTSAQDSTAIQMPQPIPVIQVISEMEGVREIIDDADVLLQPPKSLISLDSLIPEYGNLIEERKNKIRNLVNSNPAKQEIEESIITWMSYRSYLRGTMSSINTYLTRLSIVEDDISDRLVIWKLTQEAALEREAPKRVLESIEEMLVELDRSQTAIADINNHFLQVESHINDLIAEINYVIGELEVLRDSEVFDLFYLRSPPFWKSAARTESVNEIGDERSGAFGDNLDELLTMIAAGENALYLFVLIILILTGTVLLVRKSYQQHEFIASTKRLEYAREVIVKKPVLVIIFLGILVLWYLFTNTPKLFNNLILLLLLITSAFLIKPFLHNKFKFVPFWIIVVVLIQHIKTYLILSSFQYRWYSLAESLVIMGLVIYFTRPLNELKQLPLGKVSKRLLSLSPLLFLFAVVAIISNLLGYTNLTAFSLRAATNGSDLSLLVFSLIIIADSMIIGLIHHRYNRQSFVEPIKKMELESKVSRFIGILASILWIYYFLALLDLYRPVSQFLDRVLSIPYKFGTITFTLGMLVSFIGILAISFAISSLVSFLLDGKEVRLKFLSLPKGIPSAISMVIRYFVIAVGFVLAISSLGIELSKFNLMAGALGLGIGFGLQTVVSNFISGIILVFERPILPGDVVEVNNLVGTVNKIGVRSSSISTFDGSEVVVPNNNLIANDLINWTLSNNIRRLEILVGTSYDADPNVVLEALSEVANAHPMVLKNPSPLALFVKFGESSMNFRLLVWINIQNVLSARSQVSIDIYNKFKELGITIPYPQRVVHLPKQDNSAD